MLKLAATYAAKRTANDGSAWHALTRGLRRQAELNRRVASDLPLAFKWLYLLTNAPFFYVGYATLRDGHALPWCGPPAIAAAFIFAAGSASVLFPAPARRLQRRRRPTTTTRPRGATSWAKRIAPGGGRTLSLIHI